MKLSTSTLFLVSSLTSIHAFSVQPLASRATSCLWAEENKASDAVFMPPVEESEEADLLEKAELLGRGAAKVRADYVTNV